MEIPGISAVANRAAPVDPLLHESQCKTIERRVRAERACPHRTHGFRLENASVAQGTVLEIGQHEPRHIGCSRGERARRRDVVIELRLLRAERSATEGITSGDALSD